MSKGKSFRMPDEQFEVFKQKLVPVLYDFFANYHLKYSTQTCRWGSVVEDWGYKTKYKAYLSEQPPSDNSGRNVAPDTLVLAHVEVLKPHVQSSSEVANWAEGSHSPYVVVQKVIVHNGDVNKVRELGRSHPDILVTTSDTKEHYVWNVERQPDRRKDIDSAATTSQKGARRAGLPLPDPSTPDLVLVGHKQNAPFALACSATAADPRVASGAVAAAPGSMTQVLVWDLGDHVASLQEAATPWGAPGGRAPTLQARVALSGHTDTVGGVAFLPASSVELASVADDERLLLWDTRQGGGAAGAACKPAAAVEQCHRAKRGQGEVVTPNCVDWCPGDANLLVTGDAKGGVRVWDRRRLDKGPVHVLGLHGAPVINVEWHPTDKNVFASGGDDHVVALWQLDRQAAAAPTQQQQRKSSGGGADAAAAGADGEAARKRGRSDAAAALNGSAGGLAPELMFQHHGHRLGEVRDFQWNPHDPWVIMSCHETLCDDGCAADDGGVQVWRINDLIHKPREQALKELNEHREFILEGRAAAAPPQPAQTPAPPPLAAAPGGGGEGAAGGDANGAAAMDI